MTNYTLMKRTIAYLTFMGFWPKNKESTKTLSYIILLSCCFLLSGSVLYLIVYQRFGISEIEVFETVTGQFGVLYYMALFILKRDGIVYIVDLLQDFTKFGKPRYFDLKNKQLNYLLTYCICILIIATSGVFVCPMIFTQSCVKINLELNRTKLCGLVSPIWLPIDYTEFPYKHIVYFWECYCCFMTYGCGGIMSFTIIETMEHLIIRIEQLKEMFPDILEEKNLVVRKQKLKIWVDYHLHLFHLGKLMDETYRWSLSVIVLCVGILFGCIAISTMQSESSHNSIFLFMGWFQSIGVLCVSGQRLLDTSLSVGTMVYDSNWYELDVEFQKYVLMILIRSQRPILIYAGPFTNLSHLLILGVLQTAYSYINLLSASS